MGWPYRFGELTAEQKQQRRELLDWYGFVAQMSVLVPLLALQVYFLTVWVGKKIQRQKDLGAPSSPYAKAHRSTTTARIAKNVRLLARRIQWWLGNSLELLGYHLGTNGEVIAAVTWTAWLLLLLSCFQTGDDYLHLTKRFGIVGASQLPFHYLLALKWSYSPLQLLTHCSHETLISLHQLLGRSITLLFYLHVAFYLNFYILSNLLAQKITEWYIICGIIATVAFTAVGTTALAPLKRWNYRAFFITHVSLATLILPLLYFHVRHIRIYIYETAAIYAVHAVLRFFSTKTLPASIRILSDTNLVEIDIPTPLSEKGFLRPRWKPGHHAYVSLAGHPFLRTFRSNPFTVASIPREDGRIRFVARILDGNTAKLARCAKDAGVSQKVTLEGPYGVTTHADRLLQYDRVLLVAGGIGATFVVPIYRQVLADLSPSKGSFRHQKVNFVWVARTKADVTWALPEIETQRQGFIERLKVFITSSTSRDLGTTTDGSLVIAGEEDEESAMAGETEEGIELEQRKNLLAGEDVGAAVKVEGGITFLAGRPNLGKLIEQTFSQGDSERVAVLVCGPRRLSQALRTEVGEYVESGRDVWFWEESFAL
ncbi:hypothetical protein EJ03DRAFT_264096 [Teratosphaeria nubilosa]|uniref:ferric-chelate reductase (NADPH) n=1 Tax=Teratosphaeria nubilosa TaxID=161662 RepID=A0A6G1LLF2_9PEZI|nr:hypothetical protein EJ03DRAFT_264096 [Teratosphaeria nubilosa]